MTAGDLKIASLAFAIVTATVGVNLLMLQEKRAGIGVSAGIETSALKPRAAVQTGNSSSVSALGPPLAAGAAPLRVAPPKMAVSDTGANVAEIIRGIQRELDARGYEAGQPDGVAGLVTRAAIMAYEHDYGLALTATPSQELLSRIVLGSSAPPAERGAADKIAAGEADSVALMVEQQLAALGYTPGKADGRLDEHTSRAIREFEVDQKLAESGRISGPLVSRLLRLQSNPAKVAAAKAQVAPAKTKAAQK